MAHLICLCVKGECIKHHVMLITHNMFSWVPQPEEEMVYSAQCVNMTTEYMVYHMVYNVHIYRYVYIHLHLASCCVALRHPAKHSAYGIIHLLSDAYSPL